MSRGLGPTVSLEGGPKDLPQGRPLKEPPNRASQDTKSLLGLWRTFLTQMTALGEFFMLLM